MKHLKERAAGLLARAEAGEDILPLEWKLLARAVLREPEPLTWADYQQISAESYAEFDQAAGIRMVPASNPVTGDVVLALRVGGAL